MRAWQARHHEAARNLHPTAASSSDRRAQFASALSSAGTCTCSAEVIDDDFEELTLRGEPVPHKLEDMTVQVVSPDDLALLKLAAHRDQDVIDLLLLSERLSAKAVANAAELDDIERSASEGAQTARLIAARGELGDLTEELLGRQATSREMESFEGFLRDLEEQGL